MNNSVIPRPLFDDLNNCNSEQSFAIMQTIQDTEQQKDYRHTFDFLQSYTGSQGTFNSYRREVERLLHWSWLVANKTLPQLKRDDIEAFVQFCVKPPTSWIGVKKAPRFIEKDGLRIPNLEWRPFVVTLTKAQHRKGKELDIKNFALSHGAVKETFAILSSFYNYLLQEEYAQINPVALIRQKSKFIRKSQNQPKIRRLSEMQWHYVIRTAETMANANPQLHERTLFIMSALYSMYLRISELAASNRWIPSMNHFARDHDGNWWFTTVGKGNKERQIAVSDAMLEALKRWRNHLDSTATALPSPADNSPLLPKAKGFGPIESTTYIRSIVQECFDRAIEKLNQDNHPEEADTLLDATVHWLRHTGISDDVKHRPREHVRDDAGHSSGAITDRYIDVELKERHQSAKNKPILDE